jgi:hypothetical protein
MPDRAVTIGATLAPKKKKELIQFLNKNKDIFAWSAKDLQGVDRDIVDGSKPCSSSLQSYG